MKKAYKKILGLLGLDRAIAASSLTQVMRFVTGPITMILMIKYLSPEEQGFFYSFGGVVGIQVFLEAGFAQSITQFTSREYANLSFDDHGRLVGDPVSLSRLRSVFNQANRYYLAMATVLFIALAAGGYCFFSSKPDYGVPWQIPWFVITICASIGFLLTPYWAMLEGCNLVAQTATFRLFATLGGFLTTAICLLLDLGIYAAMYASIVMLVMPVAYLSLRRRSLIRQILGKPGDHQVSWRKEIWGFQWRIALTWMSRYFLESGIAPLAFQLSGPILAGKIGMTFQIVRMMGGIANTWTTTKIPGWGIMAAKGQWIELENSWRNAAKRNVTFCGLAMLAFAGGFPVLGYLWPEAAARFVNGWLLACFALGWFCYSFWLVSMHYTRALREEPYTFMHMAVGIVFISGSLLLSSRMQEAVIPVMFLIVHIPSAFFALKIRETVRTKLTSLPACTP
ncbi:MAG: hypothetical protein ACSHX9_05235 [Luteolibacter sp.]